LYNKCEGIHEVEQNTIKKWNIYMMPHTYTDVKYNWY